MLNRFLQQRSAYFSVSQSGKKNLKCFSLVKHVPTDHYLVDKLVTVPTRLS